MDKLPGIETIIVVVLSAIGALLATIARKLQPTTDVNVRTAPREADVVAYTQIGLAREDRDFLVSLKGEISALHRSQASLASTQSEQNDILREIVNEMRESRWAGLRRPM